MASSARSISLSRFTASAGSKVETPKLALTWIGFPRGLDRTIDLLFQFSGKRQNILGIHFRQEENEFLTAEPA